MEYANAYTKYLYNSFSKNTIDRQNKNTLSQKQTYMKQNKNMNYTSGSLFYEMDKNEIDINRLNDFANANLSLLKEDILEELEMTDNLYTLAENGEVILNNEKAITTSSYSFDKLKKIYESKYEEFLKDSKDEIFVNNLFTSYISSFKNLIDPLNKEIVKIYNDSNKINDKIDNLSYNEYKRSGYDYFDVTKKYYDNLTSDLSTLINLKINLKKYKDQKTLDHILLFYLTEMEVIYEERSRNILEKLGNILRVNKLVTNWEENYCNFVKNYLGYMNFIYFSKELSNTNVSFYNFILNENYKGNIPLLNSLLKKYGYISKTQALVKFFLSFRNCVKK